MPAPVNDRTNSLGAQYPHRRLTAFELANRYVHEWEERRTKDWEKEKGRKESRPVICISRKLALGVMKVADILAEKTGYRVVDHQILERIATDVGLSEKTVAIFDERYPGKLGELVNFAFGEKAFIQSDYTKRLFSVVYAIAALEPTIFIGRGVHLLLSRERLLAVRIISSVQFRVQQLVSRMNIPEEEAARQISELDEQQAAFFKEVYNKKDASAYEFDLVINRDYITEPRWAVEIILRAFTQKFGLLETCGE